MMKYGGLNSSKLYIGQLRTRTWHIVAESIISVVSETVLSKQRWCRVIALSLSVLDTNPTTDRTLVPGAPRAPAAIN